MATNNKGFTLIEVSVAVAIFSVIITVAIGLTLGSIRSQRESLLSQELIDNVSYNLEYMSRAIRMAKKDLDGDCIEMKTNYEYEETLNGKSLKFMKFDHGKEEDVCQEFFWDKDEERLYEIKNGEKMSLTPANLKVADFKIEGSDTWSQDQTPLTQPKVALFLEIEKLKIQTTISQRNLNVKY